VDLQKFEYKVRVGVRIRVKVRVGIMVRINICVSVRISASTSTHFSVQHTHFTHGHHIVFGKYCYVCKNIYFVS